MIRIGQSGKKGRGIYATQKIAKGQIIERSPVIVIPSEQWEAVANTVIYNYCFYWGENMEDAAIALGYGSLYNHAYYPNALYRNNHAEMLIEFVALRDIEAGEEINVNYNRNPNDQSPLWFDVIN